MTNTSNAVAKARNSYIDYGNRKRYIDSVNTIKRGFKWNPNDRKWKTNNL